MVIISIENKIFLTFDNVPALVDQNRRKIVDIFDKNFDGWKFNIDKIEETSTKMVDVPGTKIYCHFLYKETYEPVESMKAAV